MNERRWIKSNFNSWQGSTNGNSSMNMDPSWYGFTIVVSSAKLEVHVLNVTNVFALRSLVKKKRKVPKRSWKVTEGEDWRWQRRQQSGSNCVELSSNGTRTDSICLHWVNRMRWIFPFHHPCLHSLSHHHSHIHINQGHFRRGGAHAPNYAIIIGDKR